MTENEDQPRNVRLSPEIEEAAAKVQAEARRSLEDDFQEPAHVNDLRAIVGADLTGLASTERGKLVARIALIAIILVIVLLPVLLLFK
jgi:hypothetical protein